jgi:hypothetical protein
MFVRWCRLGRRLLSPIPGDQTTEIVAIGPIGLEELFIEKPLDAASGTDLIRIALRANRPAHLAVPATAKYHDCGAGQSGSHQAKRPLPTRLLRFVHLGNL